MGVVLAETIYDGAKTHGCQLTQIRFDNVAKTKKSALIAETVELYKAKSLDELIRNAHLAANHMTVRPFCHCFGLINKFRRLDLLIVVFR